MAKKASWWRRIRTFLNGSNRPKNSLERHYFKPQVLEKLESRVMPATIGGLTVSQAWIDREIATVVSRSASGNWGADSFSNQWVVQVSKASLAPSLASVVGASNLGPTAPGADTFVFQFPKTTTPTAIMQRLTSYSTFVSSYYPLIAHQQDKRFVPNDPSFSAQWHLQNTGQNGGTPGQDVNAVLAWDQVRGVGVQISVVDDGVEWTHPDLAANIWTNTAEIAGNSIDDDGNGYIDDIHGFDYNGNDGDPTPITATDHHGTAVAGVAAGRGDNSLGISGAAPSAQIVGARLIAGPSTDLMESRALSYMRNVVDIYSNSWGPTDNGMQLAGPGPLTLAALQQGATLGRGGLGNIFVWAGGNGRTNLDNANYDGYANSRYVIAVGAIAHDGTQSSYSEDGANLFVAAYSNGLGPGITTTDVVGVDGYSTTDYANDFGGTSSAAPLAAGVIALMLERNPNLTARDVKQILARSSTVNDPTDPGWITNGAGLRFNHKYGFGAINALAAVNMAATWTNVGAETSVSVATINVGTAVPDNNPTGISSSTVVGTNIAVETVEVTLNAAHTTRGQLRVVLTSPSGTQSVLAETHNDTNADYTSWQFTTNANWGETSQGTWTLEVIDTVAGTTGTFTNWSMRVYGANASGVSVTQSGGSTSVTEGGATDTVSVVLNSAPTSNVTVNFGANTQVTPTPAPLTFTPANWNVPQTFTVTAVDDFVAEGTHNTSLTFSSVSTDLSYNGVSIGSVPVTITDNDTAGVIFTPTGGSTDVAEGGATDTYNVVLRSQPTANVTVNLNAGTQLTGAPTSLVFTPANWNIARTVTVTAVDDLIQENAHLGTITHSVVSTDPLYSAITTGSIVANITDNDNKVLFNQTGGSTIVAEGGATDTYSLTLLNAPLSDVVVNLAPNAQVSVSTTRVTFTTATWNVPVNVTVTAIDDFVAEGDPHAGSVLHTFTSADPFYNGQGALAVVVNENDFPGINIVHTGAGAFVIEGKTDTYQVSLTSMPTSNVRISFTGDAQVTATPSFVDFTPATWNVPRTITVLGRPDNAVEGLHTGIVQHRVLSSADPFYPASLALPSVTVTIRDFNRPPTVPTIPNKNLGSAQTNLTFPIGATDADGDTLSYSATVSAYNTAYQLDQQYGFVPTTQFATNQFLQGEKWVRSTKDGRYYFILPNGDLKQYAGGINTASKITTLPTAYHDNPFLLHDAVPSVPDLSFSFSGDVLTITKGPNFQGTATVVVSVSDGFVTVPRSFTVTETNTAPVLSVANVTMSHTQGSIVIPLTANDAEGDPVSFSLFAITPSSSNVTGSISGSNLTLTSPITFAGTVWVSIISDDGFSNSLGSFSVTVTNSAPSMPPLGMVVTVNHTSPTTSFPYFPSDADGDPITITVTSFPAGVTGFYDGTNLHLSAPLNSSGYFNVILTGSDGAASSSTDFYMQVLNDPVSLGAIANQVISHTTTDLDIPISVTNPDGDALSYTFTYTPDTQAYSTDQSLHLTATGEINLLGLGLNEKWMTSTNGNKYVILSDGVIRRQLVGQPFSQWPAVTMVNPLYYQHITMLTEATAPTAPPITATVSGPDTNLHLNHPGGFAGIFTVSMTVSDGGNTATRTFQLAITNDAPTIAPIPGQVWSHVIGFFSGATFDVAATDADGDGIVYDFTFTGYDKGYLLDQQYGFTSNGNYLIGALGASEKSVYGSDGKRYAILPSGELRLYNGTSIVTSTLIETLPTIFYDDPTLLTDATFPNPSPPVTATYDPFFETYFVNWDETYVGVVEFKVTANDSIAGTSRTFYLGSNNTAPTVNIASNLSVPAGVATQFALNADDLDFDTMSFNVVVQGSSKLYDLDQQLGLNPAGAGVNPYNYNVMKKGEKWLRGNNNTFYYLLPNGNLHRWTGNINTGPLVDNVGTAAYSNPTLLWNAQPNAVPDVDVSVVTIGPANFELRIDPKLYVGNFEILLSVFDAFSSREYKLKVTVA